MPKRVGMRIAGFIGSMASAVLWLGCVADLESLHPTDQASAGDLAGPTGDLAGADLVMLPPVFADIDADMKSYGCPACHNGSIPMPDTYAGVSAEAMAGTSSKLLTKTLQGSGVTHGGPQPFASTSDPIYQRWLAWATGGAPQ